MYTYVLVFSLREFALAYHLQPTGAHVKDHIEFHSIYLGKDNLYRLGRSTSKLTTTGYHSDVSYEHQTPGITLLTLLEVPETGGDTGWTSQAAAYDRLSEPLKVFLEGLRAEHSGFQQAENARRDGHFVRREPVKSYHPIVRVHPVTKQKVLFVNPGFTRRIVGLKDEESDAILQLLFKVCPEKCVSNRHNLLIQLYHSIFRRARTFRRASSGTIRRLLCGTIALRHTPPSRIMM